MLIFYLTFCALFIATIIIADAKLKKIRMLDVYFIQCKDAENLEDELILYI